MEIENPALISNFTALTVVGFPSAAVSYVATRNPSTPGHPSPLREQVLMGIPHFYDHAGNIMNGSFGATIVTLAAGVAIELAPPEKKKAITIGAAGVAATVSSGVNVAYEAGVHIPPFAQKPDGAPFDGQDALYGSAGGLITALVFGAATVALLAKNKRQHNHGKHRK